MFHFNAKGGYTFGKLIGTHGKTDFADLRMKTDFFYEKARVSRKKSVSIRKSAKSVLPLHPKSVKIRKSAKSVLPL
jgi:hypothetical protein